MNRLLRESFDKWPFLGLIALIVAVGLLGGAVLGALSAFSALTQKSEQVPSLTYTLEGKFGYDVQLSENALYGETTLTEDDASFLFLKIVDGIEGTFSYRFTPSHPLEHTWHNARITAILENGKSWSKGIVLVPDTVRSGNFTLTFPIDTAQLLELAAKINEEIGVGGSSYRLIVQADVHTVVQTDYGVVDEKYNQSMSGTLQSDRLAWDEGLTKSETKSLYDTIFVAINTKVDRIKWSLACFAAVLLVSYLVWNYLHRKSLALAAVEKEAKRVRRQHGDVIIDIDRLPEFRQKEVVMTLDSLESVIPVTSIDALVKVSELLLKPVLHKAEPSKHTYLVIDALTMYEYVSEEPSGRDERED